MFLAICEEINFPVALEKMVRGTQLIMFLGNLIDMVNQTISILIEKRQKVMKKLHLIESHTNTVLKLQQLTGLLNFLGRVIYSGCTFTRRLYARLSDKLMLKQHYHVSVDREMKEDYRVWLKFLQDPTSVCRPFIDFSDILTADILNFYTDASRAQDKGFGVYLRKIGLTDNGKTI